MGGNLLPVTRQVDWLLYLLLRKSLAFLEAETTKPSGGPGGGRGSPRQVETKPLLSVLQVVVVESQSLSMCGF